jgi:hypothetical protein
VAHEFFVGAEEFADLVVTESDTPVLFGEDDAGLEADFVFAGADAEEDCVVDNRPLTCPWCIRSAMVAYGKALISFLADSMK